MLGDKLQPLGSKTLLPERETDVFGKKGNHRGFVLLVEKIETKNCKALSGRWRKQIKGEEKRSREELKEKLNRIIQNKKNI
jgi:hypothetical protein